jgi:hypothetical protein
MISDQPPSSYPRAVASLARFVVVGRRAVLPTLVCLCGWFAVGAAGAQARPSFIGRFMPNPPPIATTVPSTDFTNPGPSSTVARSCGSSC